MADYQSTDGNLALNLNEDPKGIFKPSVVIFGGLGFIGHYVAKGFLEKGYNVTVVDNSSNYNTFDAAELSMLTATRTARIKGAEIIQADVTNYADMRAILYARQPSAVVYLAAFPSAKTVNKNVPLATSTMISALENVARVAKELECHFAFYSSSMVYGNWKTEWVDEESPTDPTSMYGILKLAGEMLLKTIIPADRLLILRPSGAYGPYDVTDRVISRMMHNAMHGLPIKINGAETKLDFVYVTDLADVTVYGVDMLKSGTYNVAMGEGTTLFDLARKIMKVTNSKSLLDLQDRDPLYPMRGALDSRLARVQLKFSPNGLDRGLSLYHSSLSSKKLQLVPSGSA